MTKFVFMMMTVGLLFLAAGCSTIQNKAPDSDRHPAAHGSVDIRNPSDSKIEFAMAPADGENNWQVVYLNPGQVSSVPVGDATFLLRLRTVQAEMLETERVYIVDGRGKYQFAFIGQRWVLQSLSSNSGKWDEAPLAK